MAAPAEADGMRVWLLREEHASRHLCEQMSAYAERIAGDGLWLQNWPGAWPIRPERIAQT
ncbi:hypothetical protein ACFYXM_31485 [Streptomyces sp. NPDC002476]|uniref:hypothetical protein n=1 Tax=Streptomyces sp. NPDC002476 TaxID=3364648 RepID=UPI00367854BE